LRSATTFASDRGKGLLAVDIGDDALVVDTHVSFGERRAAQLALLERAARDVHRKATIVGDFNAEVDIVSAGLGDRFTLANITEPTRIATMTSPAETIDHVAVRGATIVSAEVLDGEGLSDHHPVTAEIRLDN
jgi:endonuclease/exonuclease/phosphatase family metal-dependent hydrolase